MTICFANRVAFGRAGESVERGSVERLPERIRLGYPQVFGEAEEQAFLPSKAHQDFR